MNDPSSNALTQFTLADIAATKAVANAPELIVDDAVTNSLKFQNVLLDNMRDGAVFVDAHYRIRACTLRGQ